MTEEKVNESSSLKLALEYIEQLQFAHVKNTEVISELISSLGESNKKLHEAIIKLKSSSPDSSKLWDRYFQELDSGNPRECVLNSLVELIKWKERNKTEQSSELKRYEFLIRRFSNIGRFEIYRDKKYLTNTDSLEKAHEILNNHIVNGKFLNYVISEYDDRTGVETIVKVKTGENQ